MTNSTEVLLQWEGKIVPRTFVPGFVILSYLVSYVGAWTTLELINKKTGRKGLYNWYLLIASSVTMGGVAIWCMHYIGNRAITLGDGSEEFQISYNSGFTAISFFVPILVLLAAFSVAGSEENIQLYRIAIAGTLAGLAICGMHYLGQTGISNYTCVYKVPNVVGAAIIAAVASITALTVFFVLRASWTNTWWKKALTATMLAGAVSGMHWLASVGTQYRLKTNASLHSNGFDRNSIVIVVIVLSICTCCVLLCLTILTQRRRARSADRAQQVVLASVVFDQDGRLMVTSEGLLPSQKITKSFVERSFDDIFGISHPVFLWIFRTSRNWRAITSYVPLMRNHLQNLAEKNSRPGTTRPDMNLVDENGEPLEDYSIIFRELFCIAAADLASQLNVSLESLGVLYGNILQTGQVTKAANKRSRHSSPASSIDLEGDGMSLPKLGRGQLLFVVKTASHRESEQMLSSGFRFVNPTHVTTILAHSMQIGRQEMSDHLKQMKVFAADEHILSPGVHICLFSIRASVGRVGSSGRDGRFDVLVQRDAKNLLPSEQVPVPFLEAWQLEMLRSMDSWPVTTVLQTLRKKYSSPMLSKRESLFITQLADTIEALGKDIDDDLFNEAVLVAEPTSAPCRGVGDPETAIPGTATLIAVRHMATIHARPPASGRFEFVPLNYFKAQQSVYKNSLDHNEFARRIHREFGPILHKGRSSSGKDTNNSLTATDSSGVNKFSMDIVERELNLPTARRSLSALRFWKHGAKRVDVGDLKFKSDASSEKNLVDGESVHAANHSFGGIMISQDIRVDIHDVDDEALEQVTRTRTRHGSTSSEDIEMDDLKATSGRPGAAEPKVGNNAVAAAADSEQSGAFVDKLFNACVEGR